MYNHAPKNYICPLCKTAKGEKEEFNNKEFVVYKNEFVTAYVSPKWWINNPGNVMIITNKHFENIYELPDEYALEVHIATKKIALAMKKAYYADGISTRQHNEPAGNQDVWHYHMHVFPRFKNDNLYLNHGNVKYVSEEERKLYADKLREVIK